ncbi:MAG: HPr family phosphocarrier protein, partial [candidate division KSB1 bacterium]|nr:HPr family phosphocarrier protein [candidate division KSB1 bacterium]
MAKVIVKILNNTGLHARPAAEFVKVASRFKSSILVYKNDRKVDGKSIMGVITLAAEKDSELTIEAEGDD